MEWGAPRFLASDINCAITAVTRNDNGVVGAQTWTIDPVAGKANTYTIHDPYGRTHCPTLYLSAGTCPAGGSDATVSVAASGDDGSGRQEWLFTPVAGNADLYNIQIVNGRDPGCRNMLSVPGSGSYVDLYSNDDGSGR